MGIFAIGKSADSSLAGIEGSRFWMEEWGYPDIGRYFADTPTAGHDMFCLDYRECGPDCEPTVVHVHQDGDYETTRIAGSFETFAASNPKAISTVDENVERARPSLRVFFNDQISVPVR